MILLTKVLAMVKVKIPIISTIRGLKKALSHFKAKAIRMPKNQVNLMIQFDMKDSYQIKV